MRMIIVALMACFSIIQAVEFDPETDAALIELAHAEKFTNKLLYYKYDGDEYPIRVICNPQHETLFSAMWTKPLTAHLIILADLPLPLARYLEDLFPELWNSNNAILDLRTDDDSVYDSEELEPVIIAKTVDDPRLDAQFAEIFQSTTFVNKVFYYHLDKAYYRVRVIYNPNGDTYVTPNEYKVKGKKVKTDSWNYKYGILFEYKSPPALIDHFNQLHPFSWWDWWAGTYKISDGTYVTYCTSTGNVTTTYYLDTWYSYTDELELNKK